jgi:cellulose synthase/poly-beta-1,6-N-acetylglucosamine synthase-like glycosyltransferase
MTTNLATVEILIFVGLLALIAMIYFGYPALLKFGAFGARQPLDKRAYEPNVSIIVPAHNEENAIGAKIENLLAQDYPKDRLEILIGSDGSTDRTEEIVRAHANSSVKLVASAQQCGKSAIQNLLVRESAGEALIFTDADCMLAPDAVRQLVNDFADSRVGLVTCKPVYSNGEKNEIAQNESTYLRYESWIRREESARGLLAAASGSFFGMRRSLWRPLDPNVGDDFVLPMGVVQQGYRNILDETIQVATDISQTRAQTMFRMKMRIISKDLRGLYVNRALLNPFKHGWVALALWFHKLLRWLVPYFLVFLLIDNILLLTKPVFRVFFLLQLAFYAIALSCWFVGEERARAPWSIPMSFCLVNAAAFAGVLHFATGKKIGQWKPVRSESL